MWKDKRKAPLWEFLAWLLLFSGGTTIITLFLEPYSVSFAENGTLTIGYIIYAFVGIVFSTPSPMWATYVTLKRNKKIPSVKAFCKLIFNTPHKLKTIIITTAFCVPALAVALIYGTPTGSPWYMFIAALPVMIIGGGAEEIGWRGFLQPELEKKVAFPLATIIVFAIWYSWHLPLWLHPSSNHYGDSLIGFAVMIFVWSFASASIYKATKSVFACVMYHSFINAIGAIFDWNALFDKFPNEIGMYAYFCLIFIGAVLLWVIADKKEKALLAKK